MTTKKLLQITFALVLFSHSFTFATNQNALSTAPPPKKGKIIENPDINPMYPGGRGAMMRFISSQLKYPRKCVENNEQGLVVYNFVVETDGTLSSFELMHRADSLLNKEALRIIKRMPVWRPAKYKGKFVRARQYVPMYFRLKKRKSERRAIARHENSQAVLSGSSSPKNIYKPQTPTQNMLKKEQPKSREVYSIVDQMPQFPSGEKGLREFIGKFMRYPVDAHQAGIEGRILCAFVVDKEGAVSDVEILQPLYPSLDDEAMRILSIMPRWKAGANNGKRVNVKCILPIHFSIDEEPISSVQ